MICRRRHSLITTFINCNVKKIIAFRRRESDISSRLFQFQFLYGKDIVYSCCEAITQDAARYRLPKSPRTNLRTTDSHLDLHLLCFKCSRSKPKQALTTDLRTMFTLASSNHTTPNVAHLEQVKLPLYFFPKQYAVAIQ